MQWMDLKKYFNCLESLREPVEGVYKDNIDFKKTDVACRDVKIPAIVSKGEPVYSTGIETSS